MAWNSPLDQPGTWKAEIIVECERTFLWIYTVEMLLKILAQGFLFHRRAYLRDPWGVLDFVVVTLGWLPILTPISIANVSIVRSLRVLRFLRALKMVPGMPALVESLLEVFPKLASVSVLTGFVFVVFGIVGIELFKGALHHRCALPGFEENLATRATSARRLAARGGWRWRAAAAALAAAAAAAAGAASPGKARSSSSNGVRHRGVVHDGAHRPVRRGDGLRVL